MLTAEGRSRTGILRKGQVKEKGDEKELDTVLKVGKDGAKGSRDLNRRKGTREFETLADQGAAVQGVGKGKGGREGNDGPLDENYTFWRCVERSRPLVIKGPNGG